MTSPQSRARAPGVLRLCILLAPASAQTAESRLLERDLELSREATDDARETWVLDDAEVSRRHARVVRKEEGPWEILDRDSHNGTFVDGNRVERADLVAGSVIRVGGHLLLLQALELVDAQRLGKRRPAGTRIAGDGVACRALDAEIAAAAASNAPVLILGESGTGKELIAQQLHADSRRKGPLVVVNCATLTEGVADSELFGHRQGAFSGATHAAPGLLAAAHGGTLLLDELGELLPAVQAKLLRAIESGEVRPVGSSDTRRVDVRFLAATHVDLDKAVREGRFRADLLARIRGLTISVPPLRARRDEILPLANHFLQAQGGRHALSVDAAEALLVHDWPFNVRELRQTVASALAHVGRERRIELAHLPRALQARLSTRLGPPAPALPVSAPSDADALRAVFEACEWNVTRVAQHYGKDRKQIYRWCEAFGITLGEEPR